MATHRHAHAVLEEVTNPVQRLGGSARQARSSPQPGLPRQAAGPVADDASAGMKPLPDNNLLYVTTW